MVGMGTESDVEHAPGGERLRPAFAHPSEAEFASILDFYQLAWEYEPRSFPLRHGADGRVVESFSPDFYLPELDLFIELTTLKQSLVTKKNRKLRRLRELYPDINNTRLTPRDYPTRLSKNALQAPRPLPAAPAAPAAPEDVAGAPPAPAEAEAAS